MLRDNTDVLLRRLASLSTRMAGEADRTLQDAKDAAPEDSGDLRESGQAQQIGDSWEIGFTAQHAPVVELGTAHQDAQPFLGPAADALRARLPGALQQHLEGR